MSLIDTLAERLAILDAEEKGEVASFLVDQINKMETVSIATLEAVVSHFKKEREKLVNKELLDAMTDEGLSKCTLSDGTELKIDQAFSVKQQNQEGFMLWLEEQGLGDIIKDSFDFGKGTVDEALLEFLQGRYDYSRKQGVHYQTLQKVIKEHLSTGGEQPPEELATISTFDYVKVKRPKKQIDF